MAAAADNVLRYPLDDLLGTEAHVRLLRLLLHEVDAPLGVTDAAERAGLSRAGARKALKRLTRGGFVTRVGTGRSQQYAVEGTDPIVEVLRELFEVEEARYDSALRRLRHLFQGVAEVQSAWIERMPRQPDEPLEMAVVASSRALTWLRDDLRSRLSDLEKELDLIIEIGAYSRADAPEMDPSEGIPLAGVVEEAQEERETEPVLHSQRDERALRMSRGVAQLLRSDPSLVKRAMRHIERLLNDDQGSAAQDLLEWRQILQTYSVERLRDFITSESSRAARLRQSSPFFAVLTADEREDLLRHIEDAT